MSFDDLPLELKQAIWHLCVHATVSAAEVCIIWPLNQKTTDVVHPLLVDTPFPVIMHVCREWRAFVLHPPGQPSGPALPLQFRFSRLAGCRVPYRRFRPSTDILYAGAANFGQSIRPRVGNWAPGIKWEILENVRHLAVEWIEWKTAAEWLSRLVFRALPNLQKVSVVFASSRRPMQDRFQAPARRCKLRRVEGDSGIMCQLRGKTGATASPHALVEYGRVVAERNAALYWRIELEEQGLELGQPRDAWFTGSAWDKRRQKLCLKYEAAAFAQYMRSGDGTETWVEACEDRLLVCDEHGIFQEPPSLGPSQLLRSPEDWRVNDEDDYRIRFSRQ